MESIGEERICMMNKIFIDTNILVYSIDKNSPEKQKKSRALLRSLKGQQSGVLSTQVIQEFYVASIKKLSADPFIVKNIIYSLSNFEIVIVDINFIHSAIDCSIVNKISFWDALIVVAAENAECEKIWTEDLNHRQIIRGVEIINPFI